MHGKETNLRPHDSLMSTLEIENLAYLKGKNKYTTLHLPTDKTWNLIADLSHASCCPALPSLVPALEQWSGLRASFVLCDESGVTLPVL